MSNHNSQSDKLVLPEAKLPVKPLTVDELDQAIADRLSVINQEFSDGLAFIKTHIMTVTFFGSSRFLPDHPYYQKALKLGGRLADLGYGVVTGGGPGVMEGANHGAFKAGGRSLGLAIKLPHEQAINQYLTDYVEFYYFFSRKVCLSFSAEAFVLFPGGFGTLDEFFEIITLIQTHKMPPVPVILIGRDFWQPLLTFIDQKAHQEYQTIDRQDMELYHLTDDLDEAVEIIKQAPPRSVGR